MKIKPLSEYPKIISTIADLKYNRGGVYFIYSPEGVLQYIGESATVASRIRSHNVLKGIDMSNWKVEVIRADDYGKRRRLEYKGITSLNPPRNKRYLVPSRPGRKTDDCL